MPTDRLPFLPVPLLHDQLRLVGETYLRLAEDKPGLARLQAEYWAQVARLEQRQAERLDWRRPAKTPSGMSLKVSEILAEGANMHPEKER